MTLHGYKIPKLPEQDTRNNINILNWKNYKLPVRGKITFLDDVIKKEKKKNSAVSKLELPNWGEEINNKFIHGII